MVVEAVECIACVANLIGRMRLHINGCSLARWMYPVRADAAGCDITTPFDVGIVSS